MTDRRTPTIASQTADGPRAGSTGYSAVWRHSRCRDQPPQTRDKRRRPNPNLPPRSRNAPQGFPRASKKGNDQPSGFQNSIDAFTDVYDPRSAVPRKNEYRSTRVKRCATLGANCTIVRGVTIGAYAFIGAGAVITQDVKPYALMIGVPARQIGWISAHGERLQLPLTGNNHAVCSASGQMYRLDDGQLERQ